MLEYKILVEYLIQNNIIESEQYADNFILLMSENWINSILMEDSFNYLIERQKIKVGKNPDTGELEKQPRVKTPLTTNTRSSLYLNRSWVDSKGRTRTLHKPGTFTNLTTDAAIGIRRAGGEIPGNPGFRGDLVKRGLLVPIPPDHISSLGVIGPAAHSTGGKSRGRKKQRGRKPPSGVVLKTGSPPHHRVVRPPTPGSRLLAHRETMKKLESLYKSPNTSKDIERQLVRTAKQNPLELARQRRNYRLKP